MDRAKLIKAIECRKEARKRCGNPCEETGACPYARCIIAPDGDRYLPYICDVEQICDDALELLKQREPKWISVKDGLPVCFEKTEDGILQSKLLMVYGRNQYGEKMYGTARYLIDPADKDWNEWDGVLGNWDEAVYCEITHWRELPDPPKEEEDGQE